MLTILSLFKKRSIIIGLFIILSLTAISFGAFSKLDFSIEKIHTSNNKEIHKTLKIPDIIGNNYKNSSKKLKKMGFKSIKIHEEESNHDKETVIRISPGIGKTVKANKEINIYYSSGKNDKYAEIPNLIGLSKSQAESQLKNLGFEVGTIKPENFSKDAAIIDQNPKSGFLGKMGQHVDLVFNVTETKIPTPTQQTPTPLPSTATPVSTPVSTPTSTPAVTYDNGNVQLSKNWFTPQTAPYYLEINYVSVNNSSAMSEANWTYNLLEQVPSYVRVNNLISGEVYRRVIKVNNRVVDNRVVKNR